MKEKSRRTVTARIHEEKQKFLDILEKTPVIQVACERSGVSKATFYRWKEADAEFAEKAQAALTEGNSLVSDIAISQLISAIKDKNLGAIKFWLQNHHVDYANKLQLSGVIEHEFTLSPEQEAFVRRGLELVALPTPPEPARHDGGI